MALRQFSSLRKKKTVSHFMMLFEIIRRKTKKKGKAKKWNKDRLPRKSNTRVVHFLFFIPLLMRKIMKTSSAFLKFLPSHHSLAPFLVPFFFLGFVSPGRFPTAAKLQLSQIPAFSYPHPRHHHRADRLSLSDGAADLSTTLS